MIFLLNNLVIGYQTLSSGEPSYLITMLSLAPSPESSVHRVFSCLFPGLKLTLDSCFSIPVPTFWNSLSEHVKLLNSSFFPSPFENSSFQTRLSFLSVPFHLIIVDEHCIVPEQSVCPTPVLGAPLGSIIFEDIGAIEVLLLL
jgi:hypothetical protein